MTTPQAPQGSRHSAVPSHQPAFPQPGHIPPQWGAPPVFGPPPVPNAPMAPPKRGIVLGLSALITATLGLPFGLFGTPIGFLLGLVAIGLAIVGIVMDAGRVLAIIGLVIGALAVITSIGMASVGGSTTPTSAAGAGTTPPVPTAPTTPVVQAPTTVAPAPPKPAKAITAREWQKIAKDPGAHVGESVVVYGTVTQFDSATGTESFRANVDGVRHQDEYEYETNTFLTGETSTLSDLVAGDMFRAEVMVGAPYTYTTTMGGQMTVPTLIVTKIVPTK